MAEIYVAFFTTLCKRKSQLDILYFKVSIFTLLAGIEIVL